MSESEARFFFRQIIAALAFIHSKGYAHRDLKPENLLLDDNQCLKLIDFGLCAKPKGGMENLLRTCCGSPAYAAPELICGRSYLGAEADLWSMGVLLYALLCGYLPFDDDNINILYKKIQQGKYDVPSWLSQDSMQLLGDLLQVDPKKRITMQQLVYHPWVLKGYSSSVDWQTRYFFKDLDKEALAEIALYFNKTLKEIADHIQLWNYDFLTATYYLLLFMKMQGRQPKIKSNMKKYSQFITYANCTITSTTAQSVQSTSLPPVQSSAQTNANRILVEKQLAALSTTGTPKIINASPAIKANQANKVTSKPPQQDKHNNENQQPVTPHPKTLGANQGGSNTQKPKQLFYDEPKAGESKSASKREARSKTKTTPGGNSQQAVAAKPVTTVTNAASKKDPSPETCSSSSQSNTSSDSSLSTSSDQTNESSNVFAMPSRVTRNRNKYLLLFFLVGN